MYKDSLKEIVIFLLENPKVQRIKDIAQQLHMSEKTIWNKLHDEDMNELLGNDIQMLMKTKSGISLQGEQCALLELKERLHNKSLAEKKREEYESNRILLSLLHGDILTIQDIMDFFLITKNQCTNYLKDIESRISKFQLQIERKQNAGIRINGDEINIRQLIENTVLQQCGYEKQDHHQNTAFDENITAILQEYHLDTLLVNALDIVKMIQQELLGVFTDESKKEIVLQILITNHRHKQQHHIPYIEQETSTSNMQFHKFLKIFETNRILLNENDYLYLWKRCITNRFSVTLQNSVDDKFLALSKDLLYSVLDLHQENQEMYYLIQNLAFHISQAVNRSSAGIRVHNPVLQKVKQKYGDFYSMVLTNVSDFEKEYQISLNEDEIGFITIYICAIYEKSISSTYYKVLLVSDEGVGQTQLLTMQIVNNFPNLLIHETTSTLHVKQQQILEADVIISTCPLLLRKEAQHKYIRISNFIDQQDLRNLSAHLLNMGKHKIEQEQAVSHEETIDFKYFDSNVNTKEEAIQLYLQIAEQFGYCESAYIDSVRERERRAFTSIGKGIAIPHGDDKHIFRPAVFFVRNAHEITWGDEQVNIIMFLILKFNDMQKNKQFFTRLYRCIGKSEKIHQVKDYESLKELKTYILEGEKECE